VKTLAGDVIVFGMVTSLRMAETSARDGGSERRDGSSSKWIEIELFGEGHRTGLGELDFVFRRGVATYPLPGQPVHLATVDELRRIYEKPDQPSLRIGHVAQAKGLPAHLLTDRLLGRHFAVLGTTGSGKSCAVALLLRALVDQYPHGHIVLLDPHNEYFRAFPNEARRIDPTSLQIPHWLLNFEETAELFVGRTEYTATRQTNIVKDGVLEARRSALTGGFPPEAVTVDTPVPYRLCELVTAIQGAAQGKTGQNREPYDKILAKIGSLREDRRFDFLLLPDD
jgi:DNA helicase HerA-like ATPase